MNTSAGRPFPAVFAELVGAVVDGEHAAKTLELLTRRAVELLEVTSAGIIVADPRDGYRVLAFSDEQAGLAELFQTYEEEGPALDVLASGEALLVDLAEADGRWPEFAPAARHLGIGWVHALPIRLDSTAIGALNLFRPDAGGTVPDGAVGQALSDLISIVLTQERPARRAERLAEHVQQVLNERGRIEQVKGILAAAAGTGPAEAYTLLTRYARTHGLSVTEAADDIARGTVDPAAILATGMVEFDDMPQPDLGLI